MFSNEREFEQMCKWLVLDDKASMSHQARLRSKVLSEFRIAELRRSRSDVHLLQFALAASILVGLCIIAMILISHSNKTSDNYFIRMPAYQPLPNEEPNYFPQRPVLPQRSTEVNRPVLTAPISQPPSPAVLPSAEQDAELLRQEMQELMTMLLSQDANERELAVEEISALTGISQTRLLGLVEAIKKSDANTAGNKLAQGLKILGESNEPNTPQTAEDANLP